MSGSAETKRGSTAPGFERVSPRPMLKPATPDSWSTTISASPMVHERIFSTVIKSKAQAVVDDVAFRMVAKALRDDPSMGVIQRTKSDLPRLAATSAKASVASILVANQQFNELITRYFGPNHQRVIERRLYDSGPEEIILIRSELEPVASARALGNFLEALWAETAISFGRDVHITVEPR